jgi:thioredoxin 1
MRNLKSRGELDELLKTEKYLILDFTATWCGPCQMMKPILEWVEQSYSKVVVVTIDVDKFHKLYKEHKVHSVPDIRFYRDGVEVKKFVGVPMFEEFRKAVRECLDLSTDNLLFGLRVQSKLLRIRSEPGEELKGDV